MQISVHSNIGKKRTSNQDYADYFKSQAGQILFVLCDGVGGNQAGDVASKTTTELLGAAFETVDRELSIEDSKDWMARQITQVNQAIYDQSMTDAKLFGMSTTLVIAVVAEDQLVIAHVGDSRAYIYHEGQLNQVTEDHSLVNELIRSGEISESEGQNHPQRNIVTQSIGGTDWVDYEFNQCSLAQVDDLLLCSDGLSNMVGHKTMEAFFVEHIDLDQLGQALIKAANDAGGSDNITLILVTDLAEGTVED
ncbi:Stp1/IreP family PP2C-type Ser/Thr phosphatase [Eremococcus coleocola]|uniref:Protein phosphatase 2C n=1 Tax=Eremococcus coleocola ACS-139-V-Col8 TaxID=908337 RepID=E4KNX9_9LACT|nr:Stp1/IreP family PP2C-type Ser/Thr phosphatase [Eremococcus coleocola]EFR31227.1 protein phosphatase 2C [Eremococcus coleocola ACS-139-V-Col8]